MIDAITMNVKGESKDLDLIDVWIVDDDEAVRDSVGTALNGANGIRCDRSFASCEEALKVLRSDYAPVAVLMDIEIPEGMSGIEGVAQFKAISPASEIIMLTGLEDEEQIFKSFYAGASGYLSKTASSEEIVLAVQDALKGGRPMNAAIARKVIQKFVELGKSPEEEYNLTPRETEILELTKKGFSKRKIAEKLFLSRYTVETHTKNIYSKLHVHSVVELMNRVTSRS